MVDRSNAPSVVVLGSINMDLVAHCKTLPRPGQTLTAGSFSEIPGGKGANQAVAASRAGARVSMIGRLGQDAFAARLRQGLQEDQVNVDAIQESVGPSGVALINVAEDGENQIVVVPGANGCLTRQDVEQFSQLIAEADVLLLQLEIPMDCVLHAIGIAKNCKTRVILDTAPVPDHWSEELFDVDLICPNETEAAALTGQPVETTKQAETAARTLHQFGARAVAITLGSSGTLLHDGMSTTLVEPFETDSVDATAAGDAFAGAVAVHWVESGSLPAAIRFGNAAGSLAASRTGAQPSLPKRVEIDMQHLK